MKWKKCIKCLVFLVVLVLAVCSYRVWIHIFDLIKKIENPFHSSFVDRDKGRAVKFDALFKIVKNHVLSFLKIFRSKKSIFTWLLGIPGWVVKILVKFLWITFYLINFLLVVIILGIILSISTNKRYKTSATAYSLIVVKNKIKGFLLKIFYYIKNFVVKYRYDIKKYFILYLVLSGIIEYIIIEFLLYFVSYIMFMLSLKSNGFLLKTIKVIIVRILMLYVGKYKVPVIIITIVLGFKLLEMMCLSKLRRLYEKFKCFIKYDTATVNIWNGAPGSHKTNSIVQAALASTENFIDDLEEAIFNFELEFPDFNIGLVRLIARFRYDSDFSKEEALNILNDADENFLIDLISFMINIPVDSLADYYFKLYYRGSFNASSIGILDPYNYQNGFTHYLDFDSIRFYKKQENMFHEPYENLIIPEFDKEYGSNDTDTKKNASDDGAPAFFAMFSHLVKREGKIFLDWQDKTQALRRFRAVSGFFAFNKKAKFSYIGLIKLIRKPFVWLFNLNVFLMKLYLGSKRMLDKWTVRTDRFIYKRNDVSFIYQCMKYYGSILFRILNYFEHFAYFKIWSDISYDDEGSDKHVVKYYIPLCNMYYKGDKIYESCQFNRFYNDLRDALNENDKGLQNLGYWTSIDPGAVEYVKGVKQRFYAKVLKAQLKEEDEKEDEDNGDDVL